MIEGLEDNVYTRQAAPFRPATPIDQSAFFVHFRAVNIRFSERKEQIFVRTKKTLYSNVYLSFVLVGVLI